MLSVSGNPKLKKTTTKAKAAAHGGVVLGEAQLKTSQGRRSSRQKEPPPPVRRSRHMHACSYLLLRRHSTWRSRARAASCLPAAARGRHWAAIPTHTHCLPNNESRQKAAAVDDPLVVERCMYYFLYYYVECMQYRYICMYRLKPTTSEVELRRDMPATITTTVHIQYYLEHSWQEPAYLAQLPAPAQSSKTTHVLATTEG